ncbi:hypothetical protein HDV06_006615 [Boothiomyces sp. JEL0866]|nr:hypothetical protein HDV06_006615 [Boothiomyces sp. JEL0866]
MNSRDTIEKQHHSINIKEEVKESKSVLSKVYLDFKHFIDRCNVLDLAVAVIMGAAFTNIVTSIVNGLINPIISLAVGSTSLDNAFLILACPKGADGNRIQCSKSDYHTLVLAQSAGAIPWNYGLFLQAVINFFIISVIVYFIVKVYSAAFRKNSHKKTKECLECCNDIPAKAKRCGHCLTPQ